MFLFNNTGNLFMDLENYFLLYTKHNMMKTKLMIIFNREFLNLCLFTSKTCFAKPLEINLSILLHNYSYTRFVRNCWFR